ncbi:MAG: hypothetical protein LAP40_26360 [Acidobacteriia bacterium]|nr:hypothetical protein [Terriglobia bacterium]
MKCLILFTMAAASVCAADFTTGQAARLVIGQETFTSENTNSSDTILGAASGLAYAGDTLFVADANRVGAAPINHRVLLFKNLSSQLPAPTAELANNRKCPVCLGQASLVLGQPDFTTVTEQVPATPSSLRLPTAVASDGVHLVVADTNHNRVLIWNSIPTINNQPADVVVGQPDFQSQAVPGDTPNAKSMRGPQGVWIQSGKLYVADTQNNRILIYNQLPTSNGAAADLVLGQPNFTTFAEPDLTKQNTSATASNMLNPVSVTSDGVRLFVADLGYNRVLIWKSIPTANAVPADLVLGQPDLTSSIANNSFSGFPATSASDTTHKETPVLCPTSSGTDLVGNPIYPPTCNSTLSFPRYALSDGQRLFLADGGNDRVLIFKQIPTANGQAADTILGQIGGDVNQASDAADSLRTPMSLAWDGTNLYVGDSYNRRITVYTAGENSIPYAGVRNAASLNIYALGNVALAGTLTANDSVTITICTPPAANANTSGCISPAAPNASTSGSTIGKDYTYKILSTDTFNTVVDGLVAAINAGTGDPNVVAAPNHATQTVLLAARQAGDAGNNISYVTSVSTNATIIASAASGSLTGGGDAAKVAAGTVVSVLGSNLSFNGTVSADMTQNQLPTTLGGTEVYFNGIRAPLLMVSPSQINAQIPWEVSDTTSISAYVRSVRSDGSVAFTTPVAATIVTQNPGIFPQPGALATPPPGAILHGTSHPTGVILVDGSIQAGDVATINIEDRSYSYTVQSGDTLNSVRDALVLLLNLDPKVSAKAGIAFARNIMIQARLSGPDANGLAYSSSTTGATSTGATLILTPETNGLCCANIAYSPVTNSNPAIPGELLLVYATGLGLPVQSESNQGLIITGTKYADGGPITEPTNFVSSLAGGKTANILSASLKPGTVGVFEVLLQLNSQMPTDFLTNVYIAQDIYISNIVTFPLVSP